MKGQKAKRWVKGGGIREGMKERDSSKEGPSGREQKLQLAKKPTVRESSSCSIWLRKLVRRAAFISL